MIGKHPRQAPRTLFAQKGRPAARRISRLAEAVGASTAALKDFNVLTPNDGGYDPYYRYCNERGINSWGDF